MATFNKVNTFYKALAEKVHNLASDQLVVALCASANAPVATYTKLSDLTQVSYTNLSSRNITTTSSTQSSGTYKLTLTDLTLTATGTVATFRYAVIYNDTATNKELIGWIDCGTDIIMQNTDTYKLDFDDTNGLFQIA